LFFNLYVRWKPKDRQQSRGERYQTRISSRKNWLFAGSHEAAGPAAMIYSFFAICKMHEINPFQWLRHTLLNIESINHKDIKDFYPQNFKKSTDL